MIQVLGIQDGLRAFQAHLAMAGDAPDDVPIYDRFALLSYRDVLPHDEHRFIDGPLILTDLAPLPGRALERLAAILKRLEETPLEVRVLNHPLTTPRRYELLRRFYEDGTNDHNVYRIIERRAPARWPVFVRHEIGHRHSLLLHDAAELAEFIEAMEREGIWRGDKPTVELDDTRRADGTYRRDGAFRIGAHIVPGRLILAREWWLRGPDVDASNLVEDSALAAEEPAHVEDNPHAAEPMAIFERLDIQCGRMDYSVKDGRIQVWEVNGGCDLLKPKDFAPSPRRPAHVALSQRLYDAFDALDHEPIT
jgi:hypothetical protein